MPGRPDFVTAASESDAVTPTAGVTAGLHAGAIVFGGVVLANVANYAFHFISARVLGPASYGDVASLVALAGLVSLPLGAIQVVVARAVAGDVAADRSDTAAAFSHRVLWMTAAAGAVVAVALVAASPLLANALNISSVAAVALTGAFALPAFLTPALWGLAQGLQRFWALALSMSIPPVTRIALVAVFLGAGLGVAGALGATFVAAVIGVVLPAWMLGSQVPWRAPAAEAPDTGSILTSLGPVLLGLLSITSLTTIDVVTAKVALSDHAAGIYASASLVGRLILYLPAAIVTVLLPKVSSRVAAGEDPGAIAAASVGVTVAFCAVAVVIYTTASSLVTTVAFGSGFEDVASLLPLFAVAMTGYAVLNVLLAYHLGKGSARMSYLLAAGAVAQILAFAAFHGSGHQIIAVSVVVAAALLAAHELVIERTLGRSARISVALARYWWSARGRRAHG
jgi:O-antigen/teichoic acid export membrane protein